MGSRSPREATPGPCPVLQGGEDESSAVVRPPRLLELMARSDPVWAAAELLYNPQHAGSRAPSACSCGTWVAGVRERTRKKLLMIKVE